MKPKILAMYLPQYHQIPENDAFWGKGFTDWISVRNAKPLFEGHQQPKVPLNDNYYDLSEKSNIAWQAHIAKEYGISGFGIYHYWFNSEKNLLTRPAEIIHENEDIDIEYFFAWDNISWRRTWSNVSGNDWAPNNDAGSPHHGNGILLEYILGSKAEWEQHFNYLLAYFKDKRYIKIDGKPLFVIFHYSNDIKKMCDYWDQLAKANGFAGINIVYRHSITYKLPKGEQYFYYEPSASSWDLLPNKIYRRLLRQMGLTLGPHYFSYEKVWRRLLRLMGRHPEKQVWLSGFINYDDTPRRGKKGTIFKGGNAMVFGQYLSQLLQIAQQQQKPYVLLIAWNEWSEGAYLEPDSTNRYSYLETLKKAVNSL